MGEKLRSTVDVFTDGEVTTVGITIHTPDLTDDEWTTAHQIIDQHVAQAAEATGLHPDAIARWFAAEATLRLADARAYQREAERRGVLAL